MSEVSLCVRAGPSEVEVAQENAHGVRTERGFRVQGLGVRFRGSGYRVEGLGFRV